MSQFRGHLLQRMKSTWPMKKTVFVGRVGCGVGCEGQTEMRRSGVQNISVISITSLSHPYFCCLAINPWIGWPEKDPPVGALIALGLKDAFLSRIRSSLLNGTV